MTKTNFRKRLRDIIRQKQLVNISNATAEDHIISLIESELVGSDEIEEATTGIGSSLVNEYTIGKNQLRKEIREKLK